MALAALGKTKKIHQKYVNLTPETGAKVRPPTDSYEINMFTISCPKITPKWGPHLEKKQHKFRTFFGPPTEHAPDGRHLGRPLACTAGRLLVSGLRGPETGFRLYR